MNRTAYIQKTWIILQLMAVACAVTGCGGKTIIRPATQLRAAGQQESGIRAQQKGDAEQAESLLLDSLALSTSVEDNPARITTLVNLARLSRLTGDFESSSRYVDQALKLCEYQPEYRSEAGYEKALILTGKKQVSEALPWAMKALEEETGSLKGVRRNLVARLQYLKGNSSDASATAAKALDENRKYELPEEEANSLRLLGIIERENSHFDKANKLLMEALEIDKRIARSSKIARDLEELAETEQARGVLLSTADFLERAFTVHFSAGRRDAAASIQQKLSEIYRQSGNMDQAEKARLAAERLKQHPSE